MAQAQPNVNNITIGSDQQPGSLSVMNGQFSVYIGNTTQTDPTIYQGQLVGSRVLAYATLGGSVTISASSYTYISPLAVQFSVPTGVRLARLSLFIPEYTPNASSWYDELYFIRATPGTLPSSVGVDPSVLQACATQGVSGSFTHPLFVTVLVAVTPGVTDSLLVAAKINDRIAAGGSPSFSLSPGSRGGVGWFAVEIA